MSGQNQSHTTNPGRMIKNESELNYPPAIATTCILVSPTYVPAAKRTDDAYGRPGADPTDTYVPKAVKIVMTPLFVLIAVGLLAWLIASLVGSTSYVLCRRRVQYRKKAGREVSSHPDISANCKSSRKPAE